jgi:hypothetical protein
MPHNIMFATAKTEGFTLMPVYGNFIFLSISFHSFHHLGLNVYSILKHTKLVLTIRALNKIEKKLLHALHSYDTQKDQPSPPDEP